MKGIQIDGAGGAEVLKLRDFEDPVAGEGEVVIKVVATAVTRDDSEQRQGSTLHPRELHRFWAWGYRIRKAWRYQMESRRRGMCLA